MRFAFLIAAVALASRFVPVFDHTVLFISALSPLLLLSASTPAVILLLSRRSRWATLLALLLIAGAVAALVPRFLGSGRLGTLTANLKVPGAAADTLVLAVHVIGPWPYPIQDWRDELDKLPQTLRTAAESAGPGAVNAAGDYNATFDMAPFRRLLRDGYRNASQQAGAGFAATYPGNRQVPPLIGIDHILTHNSTASEFHTVRIPGSDHLGVVATIHIPGAASGG